jgi:hypothetical protein
MATVVPKDPDWSEAFSNIGSGLVKGYTNRADERALRGSIEKLGPNPSARQILDAVTNTNTHSPEAKQNLLKNYIGVAEFEELQRKAKAQEDISREKNELKVQADQLNNDIKAAQDAKKAEQDMNDALTIIDSSKLDHAEKDALREKVRNGEASLDAIKQVMKGQKDSIKDQEEKKAKETTQKAFNELVNLVPKVGRSGIITSNLGGDTAQAFAQFTTLTGALEANLVDMVSRGTLSNTRFNYIKNDLLPKPSDTQAEIKGKLTGMALMLDLDPAALGIEGEGKDSKGRPPLSSFEKKE